MIFSLNSESAVQTQKIGFVLGEIFQDIPAVLLLSGDLGAGKTTLSQAIARGMGLPDQVTSPTYTLMNIYGDGALYHFDLYRMQDEDELYEIGFEEIIDHGVPTIIEWPELVSEYPFFRCLKLQINYGEQLCLRNFIFETDDQRLMEGLERFVKEK